MRIIRTDAAPAPVAGAPYAQGLRASGELLFISGQLGIDPATGALVAGDVGAQTARAMENLLAILEAGGGRVSDLARTTIYLTDLTAFGSVNEVYARALGGHTPARATVGVAALPLGAQVEIDAVAVLGAPPAG